MKTLITMFNSKYIHSSLAPWYLFASVKSKGLDDISVKVSEHTINEDMDKILNNLIEEKADVYSFCCYIWNIKLVLGISKKLKEKTNALIILGGPEVSFNSKEILENNAYIDFILCGEGEETLVKLLNEISSGSCAFYDIEGLSYRCGEEVICAKYPYASKCEPVSPYCKEYFDTLNGRIAYIEASRGCPFSCAFCLSGKGNNLVLFDLERIKKEIILLANSGTKTVKFIDRTFNAKTKRANDIILFIIDSFNKNKIPVGVCFHFEIDAISLDETTIVLLENAPKGLFQLEIGLQSYNKQTLRAIHRNPDITLLENNAKRLIKANNMHIHIDLIAGLPFEDLHSFRNSFNSLYKLKPHMLQLGFLKLLHGSELREKADSFECEFNSDAPYEVIKTGCLSKNDLDELHMVENSLDKLYNSNRFIRSLDYLTEECNISPYDLFFNFSKYAGNCDNMSLDEYIELFYNYFSRLSDGKILRDKLICDRISSNSAGIIPRCLQIQDKKLKKIKKYISENLKVKGKFSCAILYCENKAVYCDYKVKDYITSNYELKTIPLDYFQD